MWNRSLSRLRRAASIDVVRGMIERGEIPSEYAIEAGAILAEEVRRSIRRRLREVAQEAAERVVHAGEGNGVPVGA